MLAGCECRYPICIAHVRDGPPYWTTTYGHRHVKSRRRIGCWGARNTAAILDRSSYPYCTDILHIDSRGFKMPEHCAAYCCANRRTTVNRGRGITFHKFPKDKDMRKKWEVALRREGFTASESSVICSEHFKQDEFDRTGQIVRLRDGVIPSIFSFPVHLQRPEKGRTTSTSRKAEESLSVAPQDDPEASTSHSQPQPNDERPLLSAGLQPQLQVHRADVQLVVVKEEVPPEQQEWSSSLDLECPDPPPHIKEEQEELWINQEGEQLQGLEEADIIEFIFTPVPVKSEDDEEKPQSSQLHQRQTEHMETEADGDDCRGPKPARNSDPESSLQPKTEDDTGDSSEPDTEDSADWKETREPASGSNSLKNRHESVSDPERSAEKKPFSCSVCEKAFSLSRGLKKHIRVHTGDKPFTCSVCKKAFSQSGHLKTHMRVHTGEKPFTCTVCKKAFSHSGHLKTHMRVHTGEKPFTCTVCKKAFSRSAQLKSHMRVHTGEKPFSCTVCKKAFSHSGRLKEHMRVHTGEKPHSCSVCKKAFSRSGSLKDHMIIHTGEKPHSCSVCRKAFPQSAHLKKHMRVHSGEKPFSCSVCKKAFSQSGSLKIHMRIHTGEQQ